MTTEAKLPEGRKLHSACFHSSISLDARQSVAIGSHGVIELLPARLEANGDWVGIDKGQRADGIGIRRMTGTGVKRVVRYFVPWANVTDLGYAE